MDDCRTPLPSEDGRRYDQRVVRQCSPVLETALLLSTSLVITPGSVCRNRGSDTDQNEILEGFTGRYHRQSGFVGCFVILTVHARIVLGVVVLGIVDRFFEVNFIVFNLVIRILPDRFLRRFDVGADEELFDTLVLVRVEPLVETGDERRPLTDF